MKLRILGLLAALVTTVAGAQVYSIFSPGPTGPVKSNGSFALQQEFNSDIIALWTGSCSASTWLSGSGACSNPVAGSNTQIQYNSSGVFGASSLLTFTPASVLLNIGAGTTPGTFSVGQLDSMVINGVTVPIPGFALNSNIQGVFENHSYVNGVASGGARYYGVRSEGTIALPTIVVNGDHLSTWYAAGYNGTNYSLGASIMALVDGTPGASAMPTDLDFAVSPAGSQVPTSRLTLKTDGSYAVSGSVGSVGQFLRSAGTGVAAGWSTLVMPNAATTGDILYATSANTVGNLPDVNAGSFLRSGGTGIVPAWSAITVPNSATLGDIWYGSAANVVSALAGNTTASQLFLAQTGTGAVSAAPTWSTLPGSFSGFANPSGLIGLTAVNGAATTATRSDATHALDQSIAPTWTGVHTFSNSVTLGSPTGGNCGAGCLNAASDVRINNASLGYTSGTFTLTYTGLVTSGCNPNPGTCTNTASYVKYNNGFVTLMIPNMTGGSSATTFTATGLIAALQPSTLTQTGSLPFCENASGTVPCNWSIAPASGTITFFNGTTNGGAWGGAASGTKGLQGSQTIVYSLQ